MMTDVLQWLMSFGAKAAYTVILAVIITICASEILKIWFDRSLVLSVFEYNKDGASTPANGRLSPDGSNSSNVYSAEC